MLYYRLLSRIGKLQSDLDGFVNTDWESVDDDLRELDNIVDDANYEIHSMISIILQERELDNSTYL